MADHTAVGKAANDKLKRGAAVLIVAIDLVNIGSGVCLREESATVI